MKDCGVASDLIIAGENMRLERVIFLPVIHRLPGYIGKFSIDGSLGDLNALNTVNPTPKRSSRLHSEGIFCNRFCKDHKIRGAEKVIALGNACALHSDLFVGDAKWKTISPLKEKLSSNFFGNAADVSRMDWPTLFVGLARSCKNGDFHK